MARVGLFEETPSKWIQFDEDTEICVRFISKEEAQALSKKSDKLVKLSGGDALSVWNQLIADKAVVGWRNIHDHSHPGLLDAAGRAIPFTAENRDMLMKKCREFSLFVSDNCTDSKAFLEDEQQKSREHESIKNG